MTEVSIRRPASGLAIERRLEALSIPAMGLAGGAIVLIHLTEKWVQDGPFSKDMRDRFLELYGAGSFGVLKIVMIFTLIPDLLRRFGPFYTVGSMVYTLIRNFPSIQRATLYRGRRAWFVSDPFYGTYGIIYCAWILVCVISAYYDTLACYTRSLGYSVKVVAYEPCESVGVDKPEFQVCKSARSWIFFVQMLSLGFAIVPAAVHGLSFAVLAYKIYTSFAWMNKQLRTIREARARRPEIDDELYALEAQDKLMAAGIKRAHDLEAPLRSQVEVGFDRPKLDLDRPFEQFGEQKTSMYTNEKDCSISDVVGGTR